MISIMDARGATGPQRGGSRQALRAVMSFAAIVGLAYLLLISVVLAATKCGDECDGATVGPEHWQWTAQLVLAVAGFLLGAVALGPGFTSKARGYRAVVAGAVVCVLAWLVWVIGFGAF